jgi:sugar/nucleoside kinase (ribokinase family)
MSQNTVIRECGSIEEAVVLAGYLQANGIPAIVPDYNMAINQWMMSMANSCRVVVPSAAEDEANALLEKAESGETVAMASDEQVTQQVKRRDRWKVWVLETLSLNYVFYVLIFGLIAFDRVRRGERNMFNQS